MDFNLEIFDFGLKSNKPEDFLNFIRRHKIGIIIDVRHSRGERYTNWWGSGRKFEKLVKKYNYTYYWFQQLGIPWGKRKKYENTPEEMRKVYINEIIFSNFDDFLRVYDLAVNHTICLICVEDLIIQKYCHRIWLKKQLLNYHIKNMENKRS